MAADQHEALIRAYIDEVFNGHRVDALEKYWDDDLTHPSCWKRPSRSSSTQSSISLPPTKRPMMMTVHVTLRPDAAIPCHSPCWVAYQWPRQTPRSSAKNMSSRV